MKKTQKTVQANAQKQVLEHRETSSAAEFLLGGFLLLLLLLGSVIWKRTARRLRRLTRVSTFIPSFKPRSKKSRRMPIVKFDDGYVRIERDGRERLEHREIAENVLGRPLKRWEVVHHINGKRADNRPDNLCVMSREDHDRYHNWYDWIKDHYGKYPRRATQLRKLRDDFRGTLLSEFRNKRRSS